MAIGLEILFIINVLVLLAFWGWFVMTGFNTSRGWGLGLLLFFPISPFVFAYRFERKTRKIIYYFIGSLVAFSVINTTVYFATTDFFPMMSNQVTQVASLFEFKEKPKPKLVLPPPTYIPGDLPAEPKKDTAAQEEPEQTAHVRRYQTLSIDNAQHYVGKKVIVHTAFVEHRGALVSASQGQIEIRKDLGVGSTLMSIPKNKVEKFEVYL